MTNVDCEPKLVLGVGCTAQAGASELIALAEQVLSGCRPVAICTLDIKYAEPAVQALAAFFDVPVTGFTAGELELLTPRLKNPSEAVFRAVGCHGVAEAAALAGAGETSCLIVEKTSSPQATVAVAAITAGE